MRPATARIPFPLAAGFRSGVLLQALNGIARRRIARRPCRACGRISLFLGLAEADECWRCVRCGSNRRYGLAAEVVRDILRELPPGSRVVETDFRSPLGRWIEERVPPVEYVRTAFVPGEPFGAPLRDRRYRGARNEDLTALRFEDRSVDLLIACDVLEHVERLDDALAEVGRVLKPGASLVFSVPQFRVTERSGLRLRTALNEGPSRRKAHRRNGDLVFDDGVPEFHIDPHSPAGVPVFWSFGPDARDFIQARTPLRVETAAGPDGPDRRVIFRARKVD